MEVDGSNKASQPSTSSAPASQTIMTGAGTAGSVTCSLHPLVIMNVSCDLLKKKNIFIKKDFLFRFRSIGLVQRFRMELLKRFMVLWLASKRVETLKLWIHLSWIPLSLTIEWSLIVTITTSKKSSSNKSSVKWWINDILFHWINQFRKSNLYLGLPWVVFHWWKSNREWYRRSQTDLWNQWKPSFLAIES